MCKEYSKLQGGAGHHGGLYQIILLLLFFLKAYQRNKKFRLSTEDKAGEKFDDIILQEENEAILVQVKHKASPKDGITQSELFSEKSEFSLPTYLDSYSKTSTNSDFPSQTSYVLCTNVDLEDKAQKYAIAKSVATDNIFYNPLKTIQPIVYSFNKTDTIDKLKVCRKNISEEIITNFLKSLQLIIISDDTIEDDIKGILKGLSILDKKLNIDFIYYFMIEKIRNWFGSKKAYYLKTFHVETFCYEITSSEFINKIIKPYEDVLSSINIQLPPDAQVVMVKTSRYLILMAKLYQQLQIQNKSNILIVDPDWKFYMTNVIEAFHVHLNFTYLVCRIPSKKKEEFISNLENVLKSIDCKSYKKVIILTEDFTSLNCPQEVYRISDDTFYNGINLTNIKRKNYDTNSVYYIDRSFVKSSTTKDRYSEECFIKYILDNQNKTFLISDLAGMGKSTGLLKLANVINTEFKNFFAINIDLNNYVPLFSKCIKNKIKLELKSLINYDLEFNMFEEQLLTLPNTIVLFLNALNELSNKHLGLVLQFIKDNIENTNNIYKIIASTRPDNEDHIINSINAEVFTFKPLETEQQVNYITNHWMTVFKDENKEHAEKYKIYSYKLLDKLSSVISQLKTLLGTPLMIRIIADIFQPNAQEYCINLKDNLSDDLYKDWNILNIYDEFIARKKEIYVEEKGKSQGNKYRTKVLSSVFDKFLKECQILATTILDTSNFFDTESFIPSEDLCDTGLITLSRGKFQFLHPTYAEYFFVKQLFGAIMNTAQPERIENLIRSIVDNYYYKYPFLDCLLQRNWIKLDPRVLHSSANVIKSLSKNSFYTLLSDLTFTNNKHIIRLLLDKCETVKTFLTPESFCHILEILVMRKNCELVNYLLDIAGDLIFTNVCGEKILLCACETGQLSVVKKLHKNGTNLSAKDIFGHSVHWYAAESGNLELTKYLVEMGDDIDCKNFCGETALFRAVVRNRFNIAKYLIDNGADINVQENDGNTLLHWAVKNSNLDLVIYLVDKGVNLDCKNCFGKTILHLACENNMFSIVEYLTKVGINLNAKDVNGDAALHYAVIHSDVKLVSHLINKGADLNSRNKNGKTVLHLACERNFHNAKYLVERGMDLDIKDNDGNSVLHSAVLSGNLEMIDYLVDKGIDLNCKNINGETILHAACKKGLSVTKCLLEKRLDLNAKDNFGNTVLHLAVQNNNLELVKYLVEVGADLDSKNRNKETALHLSCEMRKFNIARFLIEKGIKLNEKDRRGDSALHLAIQKDNVLLMDYLAEKKVDIDLSGTSRETMIYLTDKDNSALAWLIERGLNVNCKDICGDSLIHHAVRNSNLFIVNWLVNTQRANLYCLDSNGKTVFQLACLNKDIDVVSCLLRSGLNLTEDDESLLFNLVALNTFPPSILNFK